MSSAPAKIGVTTATIIGMNAMIGSGIFSAPAAMAVNVGPAGILAYLFVVVSVWFIAQSLARVAYLYPQEGSFYLYTKQWAGHWGGLIAIGAYFIGLLIAMGLLCQMAGSYLEPVFPLPAYTLGLITLAGLVILNIFGVTLSQLGQQILIVCTVFPLVATTILCLFKADFSKLIPFAPFGFGNVFKATRIVIFGFFGFECAASLSSIVDNPGKNVPRALTYSILIVGAIYTLFISAIILSTPLELFTHPFVRVPDILAVIFPDSPWLITLIGISILSAILGTIHSMIWSSSHLLTLIAHKVSPSWSLSQRTAVLMVGFCIFISYISVKNPDLFFFLTACFIPLAYIMSMITLLTLKSEWKNKQNIKTVLGLITASAIFMFALEGLIQELVKLR